MAKNLKLLIKGLPNSKLATYSTGYPLALVSLGRNEGLAQLPLLTLSGCLPGKIKSRDLFISKTRKQMGLDGWLQSVEGCKCLCSGFQTRNSFKQRLVFCPYGHMLRICAMVWNCGCLNGDEQSVYYVYHNMYKGTFLVQQNVVLSKYAFCLVATKRWIIFACWQYNLNNGNVMPMDI